MNNLIRKTQKFVTKVKQNALSRKMLELLQIKSKDTNVENMCIAISGANIVVHWMYLGLLQSKKTK